MNKKTNFKFYKILSEFYKLSKIPVLLNTSFSKGEPMVCSPKDAIKTFKSTNLDAVIIGNYLITRN